MENKNKYNLTNLVMINLRMRCIPGPNRDTILEYYLNRDFMAILGNIELTDDNGGVLNLNEKEGNRLRINSNYYAPIEVTCTSTEKSGSIMAMSNDQILFHIIITDEEVINDVYYKEDQTDVHEIQKVSFKNGDAENFSLTRSENGELVYDGELVPLLVKCGEMECFQFQSNMEYEKTYTPSIIQRICDSINDNSVVSIHTGSELHSLADYAQGIFASLRTKLESYRVKATTRVRKDPNKK